ncbi:recombinase family protein, partial [Citrobacter sp. TBCS-11]
IINGSEVSRLSVAIHSSIAKVAAQFNVAKSTVQRIKAE